MEKIREGPQWSNFGIIQLHKKLLDRSIKYLNDDKTSIENFNEIADWVERPIIRVDYAIPFSFQVCCLLSDLDPVNMQNALLRIITKDPRWMI